MHLLFVLIRGYVGHSVYLTKFGSRYAVWTQSRSAEVKYLTVFPSQSQTAEKASLERAQNKLSRIHSLSK